MKMVKIDVEIEIPADEVQIAHGDFKEVIDRLRGAADSAAAQVGGEVRTDVVPEFEMMRAIKPASSFVAEHDVLLVASRWEVWVPESFDPALAAANSR